MISIQCHFYSHVLRMDTSLSILLPQKRHKPIVYDEKKYPVLYLLHGQSQDYTAWIRNSNIELYLAKQEVAVVMPNMHKSFYTNMLHGDQYFTFLTEEIPAFVQKYFPISNKRDEIFVIGLSMGGYGAFKWALTCPDKINAAASMSGAVDIANVYDELYQEIEDFETLDEQQKEYINIFGLPDNLQTSGNDLRKLALQLHLENKRQPLLYQYCGYDDYLYEQNTDFAHYVQNNTSLRLIFKEGDGSHNWHYWNDKLFDILKVFDLIE